MTPGPEVQRLRKVVAREHQWGGGYFCSCGHELNSPYGFSLHVLDALLAVPEVASLVGDGARVERVRAMLPTWTQATCQTDGAPCSWHRVAAECAAEVRAALDQGGSDGGGA